MRLDLRLLHIIIILVDVSNMITTHIHRIKIWIFLRLTTFGSAATVGDSWACDTQVLHHFFPASQIDCA